MKYDQLKALTSFSLLVQAFSFRPVISFNNKVASQIRSPNVRNSKNELILFSSRREDSSNDHDQNIETWRKTASRVQEQDAEAVLTLNSMFYRTLSDRDMSIMHKIWSNEDSVQCLHPGLPLAQGFEAVMKLFRKMFISRESNKTKMIFTPKDVKVHVRGSSAWISCIESASVVAQGTQLNYQLSATNLFRKVGKKWFMIHHHTSPFHSTVNNNTNSYAGGNNTTLGNLIMSRLGNNMPNGARIIHIRPRDGLNQAQVFIDSNDLKNEGNKVDNANNALNGNSFKVLGGGNQNSSDSDSIESRIRAAVQENASDCKDSDRNITRKTVAAIRDICLKGKISKKEKQALLMDIIKNATSETPSVSEVAYELLLSNQSEDDFDADDATDDEEAWKEFVEQCKIFAAEIISRKK
mmetsp:Transcript_11134/g.15853  ORF Transcript_11134/g.15853 Transcript_11134/m.15853 type:complete len:410 (-) Transcript_11134:107-1336(-)